VTSAYPTRYFMVTIFKHTFYLYASCSHQVLDIAMNSGSQGIHPGYGFLSENSTFATAVGESGLTFIGPSSSAILAMGSKSHSKVIMEEAGVPTTPGYHGENQDPDYLKHEAVNNVGFPLLIKGTNAHTAIFAFLRIFYNILDNLPLLCFQATMGGGGKGMRLVWDEAEFLDALDSCKRESLAAFGDTNVILERYLVHPRHIEIQVIADNHGNAVYLHERDCSLQRRHQKIIEEAPASDLPIEFRTLMGEVAAKAAKAVGYVNAGTVEFLVDSQSDDNDFYFCEMNTRLQVREALSIFSTRN
jgi:3-methylcrotonyl-CoA carboxylase alpha subunit